MRHDESHECKSFIRSSLWYLMSFEILSIDDYENINLHTVNDSLWIQSRLRENFDISKIAEEYYAQDRRAISTLIRWKHTSLDFKSISLQIEHSENKNEDGDDLKESAHQHKSVVTAYIYEVFKHLLFAKCFEVIHDQRNKTKRNISLNNKSSISIFTNHNKPPNVQNHVCIGAIKWKKGDKMWYKARATWSMCERWSLNRRSRWIGGHTVDPVGNKV